MTTFSSNDAAKLANLAAYDEEGTRRCIDASPHLKHNRLCRLYRQLAAEVFERARVHSPEPAVLDLGAGEGSATLPFLELGARVTAVDLSESQLAALAQKCRQHSDRLAVHCEDIGAFLQGNPAAYDIVVMNSFIHHLPDYLSVIRQTVAMLRPGGQFFSFQDPLRYDSIGRFCNFFSQSSYFAWRIFQGQYVRGLKTRIRRIRGIYVAGSEEDDAEYHVTRNGVDQAAVLQLLKSLGFSCTMHAYFSTQSSTCQSLGELLGVKNTFAVVAQKA